MEVTIDLEKGDWKLFHIHMQKRLFKKKDRKKALVSLVLWAIAGVCFMVLFRSLSCFHWPTAGFLLFFSALIFASFIGNLYRSMQSYAPAKEGVFVGRHKFVFTHKGIFSTGHGYESRHDWSIVKEVEQTEDMILVYLDTAYAFVFPKKKLENPEALFLHLQNLHLNRGKNSRGSSATGGDLKQP